MTTLAVGLSGFDALDHAAAAALTEPTADLSALPPAAAAEVSGFSVGQFLKSSFFGPSALTPDNQQNLDTLYWPVPKKFYICRYGRSTILHDGGGS